jgi:AraC family transcriptional regulator
MTKFFNSIDQYFDVEPNVSVQTLQMNGVLVSALDERSNDISIASTGLHSLLLSLSGSEFHQVRIGDAFREAPTQPGDVALIPSGIDLHSAWKTKEDSLKTVTLEFGTSMFKIFAPELFNEKFAEGYLVPSNYWPRPELASLVMLFKRELDSSSRRGKLFSESLIRLLSLEIAATAWSVPSALPNHGDRRDLRVEKAVDYVEANYLDDISLVDIADAAGLSPTYLVTQFRRHAGMTPYSYVINRRVRHACTLLTTTDMPIAQVALESGFSDQQHLTRLVHARMGETPKVIRLTSV